MYMKVYEAVFDESEEKGIYALSVVENPAMEDLWIALNEHPKKIELTTIDESKRLLLGAALIPNKKIYRNVDGHEFYITFSEQTIEKLAHSFFKNQNNNNSTLEHDVQLDGMSVVEGWTVQDPLKDKSANFGKEYPKGTFVTMMKVNNDDIWSKVKSGEVKGFSIDAFLNLKPLELNKQIFNTNKMSADTVELKKSITEGISDAFKAFFKKDPTEEEKAIKLAEQKKIEDEEKEIALQLKADEEANKKIINDAILEFNTQVETKISEMKIDFTKQLEAKEEEITELKAELAKKPEVDAITITDNDNKEKQRPKNFVEFLNTNLN